MHGFSKRHEGQINRDRQLEGRNSQGHHETQEERRIRLEKAHTRHRPFSQDRKPERRGSEDQFRVEFSQLSINDALAQAATAIGIESQKCKEATEITFIEETPNDYIETKKTKIDNEIIDMATNREIQEFEQINQSSEYSHVSPDYLHEMKEKENSKKDVLISYLTHPIDSQGSALYSNEMSNANDQWSSIKDTSIDKKLLKFIEEASRNSSFEYQQRGNTILRGNRCFSSEDGCSMDAPLLKSLEPSLR